MNCRLCDEKIEFGNCIDIKTMSYYLNKSHSNYICSKECENEFKNIYATAVDIMIRILKI